MISEAANGSAALAVTSQQWMMTSSAADEVTEAGRQLGVTARCPRTLSPHVVTARCPRTLLPHVVPARCPRTVSPPVSRWNLSHLQSRFLRSRFLLTPSGNAFSLR
ncbi:hypothetical protein CgunFtcFv8_002423 [Champsocephalus gunnari]|uniref:Uncharacterized protein n=1 Tax=Champsocephalus gunnari TaxID=52237 RepID=A0AAN8HJG1_CHAGU|nr:hypothetical protein CgunFtcFv8_002423 [Champsocephalus gunnari]